MGSKFLLHYLGLMQMFITCDQISEMVVWLTARLSGKEDLYVVGTASFTEKGIKIVLDTASGAMVFW